MKVWIVAVIMLTAALTAAAAPAPFAIDEIAPAKQTVITDQERQTILQGKVVTRDAPKAVLGGVAITYIPVPPQQVWNVVTGFNQYIQFMPDVIKMQVIESTPVFAHLYSLNKSPWPMDDVQLESENVLDSSNPAQLRMAWKATKTNLKMAQGYWMITPWEAGSLVVYEMNFDMYKMPHFLARSSGKEKVERVMQAVRNRTLNENPAK